MIYLDGFTTVLTPRSHLGAAAIIYEFVLSYSQDPNVSIFLFDVNFVRNNPGVVV